MNAAALMAGNLIVTWPAVFAALGAGCAMLLTMALWLWRGRSPLPLGIFFPTAVLFALVLGRLVHWYSHPLLYAGFPQAMTVYHQGGFSLSGAALGVLLSAALCRASGLIDSLSAALDALAPAGAMGLAVGRLGSLFDLSDRGRFALTTPALQRLPFAVWTETAGGAGEWRLAVFMLQCLVCALLALLLTAAYLRGRREGTVFRLFLALYGAAEIWLDSARYDADFFRFNGFIHINQILCLAAVLLSAAWSTADRSRQGGLRPFHAVCWGVLALSLAGAGWMEYFVQRRPDRCALGYALMAAALLLAAVCAAILAAERETTPPARPGKRKKPEKPV